MGAAHTVAAVYADGGLLGPNPCPDGGTYAWRHVDAAGFSVAQGSGYVLAHLAWRDLAQREPGIERPAHCLGETVTNNQTEFIALIRGLEALPEGWSGRVCSDSQVTIRRVFDSAPLSNLPREWIGRGSAAIARLGRCEPILLNGHPTKKQLLSGTGHSGLPVSRHNQWCDEECVRLKERWRERMKAAA